MPKVKSAEFKNNFQFLIVYKVRYFWEIIFTTGLKIPSPIKHVECSLLNIQYKNTRAIKSIQFMPIEYSYFSTVLGGVSFWYNLYFKMRWISNTRYWNKTRHFRILWLFSISWCAYQWTMSKSLHITIVV